MENQEETIVLEIEGSPVECTKQILIENSDYFSAMFKGSFKESFQKKIIIKDVDLKSFNTILLLLWDESYLIDVSDVHMVLQAASMLQFNSIKKICVNRIIKLLNPSICITIWKTTELLDIFPLWVKAKSMALEEFMEICDSRTVLDLSLDDICLYLGHVHLKSPNEMSVFQTALNWWYENQELNEHMDSTKIILRLLNCIDFKKLKDNDIKEMQTFPDIADNSEIVSILNCVMQLLGHGINVDQEFSEDQIKYATHLCHSKSRQVPEMPCILLQTNQINSCPNKKNKYTQENDANVVIYDKFRRRTYLHEVSDGSVRNNRFSDNSDILAVIYDGAVNQFRDFFSIDGYKIKDTAGFKFLAYKELILFYGGEYILGAGNWNSNVWSYDTIKERWERICLLPQGRRHFETIVVGNRLYIIGGIGKFRVMQKNLLWYDFKSDEWSSVMVLPDTINYFKCCSFNGQLFIVSLSERQAYVIDSALKNWRGISIMIEDRVANEIGGFAVFSDNQYIYINGKHLIKFIFDGDALVPINERLMKDIDYEEIESVLCNNIVYTLYKCVDEQYNFFYTFDALNLETNDLNRIFEKKLQDMNSIEVGNKLYCLTQYTKLFCTQYYYLVKDNILVNDVIP